MSITFAILKERKNPPDRRVVFSPEKLKEAAAQFPEARFIVESSDIRVFQIVLIKLQVLRCSMI